MNYYEHHIGDYAAATAHLSFVEDAAYSRLLRIYYRDEKPLPADVKAVQRLAGARAEDEREAVAVVLNEFFALDADGWHSKRCDEEIARFKGKQDAAEEKRGNEAERQRRHRERRKELFDALRAHGIIPKFDTPTNELETMLSRVTGALRHAPETRDATATHTPDTSHQSPDTRQKAVLSVLQESESSTGLDTHRERVRTESTTAGAACKAMKSAGLATVSPAHPELLALIEAGATAEQFAQAAVLAVSKDKGFAYALGVLKGQIADARAAPRGSTSKGGEAAHARNHAVADEWLSEQTEGAFA